MESASSIFSAWAVFYTLAGSSAAALTGLTFVVITLMQGRERRTTTDGVATFSTPTVAHFTAVLMISGLLCAPWPSLLWPETLLALIGACGVSYHCRLALLARTFNLYTPDIEDWMWYTFLPMAAYGIVFASAVLLASETAGAVYAPAAGVALLILVGIHNSWDVVTYITIGDMTPPDKK